MKIKDILSTHKGRQREALDSSPLSPSKEVINKKIKRTETPSKLGRNRGHDVKLESPKWSNEDFKKNINRILGK